MQVTGQQQLWRLRTESWPPPPPPRLQTLEHVLRSVVALPSELLRSGMAKLENARFRHAAHSHTRKIKPGGICRMLLLFYRGL